MKPPTVAVMKNSSACAPPPAPPRVKAGAPVELPADWDRLADCQKAIRIDDLEKVAKRIERRAAFAARYGCEVKA